MKIQLQTNRLILRDLEDGDWYEVHQYASIPDVSKYQPWGPNTEEETREFVIEALEAALHQPRERYALGVVLKETKQLIGAVELNIKEYNRSGELSYILHPEFWGNGFASEAAKRLVAYGFKELELHKIFATCDPRNTASSNLLQKLGMTYDGRLRDDLFIRDGWRDSSLFSLLENEY
ncbi:GNAT family N-acetyltransferase [Jeotgalibacillus sp. R-1-5s-1]|uniref:GNAT family N-acetyltransferase n=1 Tax=Jeotgalibacillus sp. R-1-5s-1 TaxID=2555897 RepID=UPI00106A373B|nr:GNAT family protein [Jeotgalibacillus sp. R-1-5s-1]TFD94522.1 N-acetyltransferase [Jeotgalibacillus sp. R-1-5s-1]